MFTFFFTDMTAFDLILHLNSDNKATPIYLMFKKNLPNLFLHICVFDPGPSLIGVLKKDWASPNSIALSWQQPEETTLPVLEYEVKYYEKVKFCTNL